MWSRAWGRATERAFLRGIDGATALLAGGAAADEAGREVLVRLVACCFDAVALDSDEEDGESSLAEAQRLLALRDMGEVADEAGARVWLAQILSEWATGRNDLFGLRAREAGYIDPQAHPAWGLLRLSAFARRLRLFQAATRSTAVALGEACGLGAHHVARWASDSSRPSPAQRGSMARAMGLHPGWLAEERDDTAELDLYRYDRCPCGSARTFTRATLDQVHEYGAALAEDGPVHWCDGCGQAYLRAAGERLVPLPLAHTPDPRYYDRLYGAADAEHGGLGAPWPHALWSPGTSPRQRGPLRVPDLLTRPPLMPAAPRVPVPTAAPRPRRSRPAGAQRGVLPAAGIDRTMPEKVQALVDWVGGTGRALTGNGHLKLADARALVEALDTGDAMTEVIAGEEFPIRSSAELAGLHRLLSWAQAAGLLRIEGNRLEPVPGQPCTGADPGALGKAMFDALPQAALAVLDWAMWNCVSPLAESDELDAALVIVWDLLGDATSPLPASQIAEAVWQSLTEDGLVQYEEPELVEKLVRRDVRIILELCRDAGAVDLFDDAATVCLTEFGRARTAPDYDRTSHGEQQLRQPAQDDFADMDWVMWRLEVRDPRQLVAKGLADRTAQSMTELAGTLGCVYSHCVDDDSMDGTAEGTYYAWYVRLPQAEHQRRGPGALPVAVTALQDHLRSVLPDALTEWRLAPDGYLTRRVLADAVFKDVYADVIGPLEVALLGLRRDGAEKLDPDAQMWAQTEDGAAATYALLLCKNPDAAEFSSWLVLYVGYLAGPQFWDSPLGHQMRRFEVCPGQPVLTLPRPGPVMWVASVETLPITPGSKVLPTRVGARHQWTASTGAQLADRVKRDLRALLPGF